MNIINKNKRANWSTLTQVDPPDFGSSKRLPRWLMNLFIKRRRKIVKKIFLNHEYDVKIKNGFVSIVILSCKRLKELQRLVHSLKLFFENIEDYKYLEFILVDNGSGDELINWAKKTNFFNNIIRYKKNIGMAAALNDAYKKVHGEFIMLIEDDFVIKYNYPFIQKTINIFTEFNEIGIIRLKNQRNWGKKYRIIGPLRKTKDDTKFWTWFPSLNGKLNVWAAGSVIFRKISLLSTGEINFKENVSRNSNKHQGVFYEEIYGKRYNKKWLAGKIYNCYPFIQPNDNEESPGWKD